MTLVLAPVTKEGFTRAQHSSKHMQNSKADVLQKYMMNQYHFLAAK